MRKLTFLVVVLLLIGGIAFAQGMWKDGTYTAEGGSFSHGWKNMVMIVVENGYIVEAHFDASVQGEYGMVANSDAQDYWYVQVDRAAQYLLQEQDPSRIVRRGGDVDALSGVSVTIVPHFELAQQALRNARR
mgnify:CR=1 FL=1